MHLIRSALVTATIAFALGARAIAATPFDANFVAWDTAGDVSEQTGGFLLTTASLDFDDDFPAAAGAFNFSGFSAIEVGSGVGPLLEDFVGVPLGGLDPDPLNGVVGFEGSGLRQTFSVLAGDILLFDWNFFTNEGAGEDFAFITLNGAVTALGSVLDAATPSSIFTSESGWATFTHQFLTAGEVTLALGVVDVGDFGVTSALQLHNFSVIPEPSTYGLMSGLLVLGFAAWRRRLRRA